MTIAFRASSNGLIYSSNQTFTEPTGAASGDVLLCMVTINSSTSITPPTGWTTELDVLWNGSTQRTALYSIRRGASAPSYTFTNVATGSPDGWEICAYSGADATTYVDVAVSSLTNASGTTPSSPSITTVTDNAMLVCCVANVVTNTITAPSGMTLRQPQGDMVPADVLTTTHGATGSKQWTLSSASASVTWSIALRPSVAPGTIAFRSAQQAASGSGITSLACSAPSGLANGDFLVAWVGGNNNLTIATPPSGWASRGRAVDGAANYWGELFTKTASSEPGSWTWNFSGTSSTTVINVLAYSGADSAPYDVAAVANASISSPNVNITGVTAASANEMIVAGVWGGDTNSPSWTPPSGMTERVDYATASSSCMTIADAVQTGSGATGTKAFVFSTAGSAHYNQGATFILAFKPPAAVAANLALGTVSGAGSVTATVSAKALLVPAATHGVATANATVIANALLSVTSAGVGVATAGIGAPAAVVPQATHGTATATMTALGPGGAVAFSLTSAGVATAVAAIKTTMLGSLTAAGAGTAILLVSIKPENPRVKMHGGSASFTQIGGGRVQIAH